MKWIVLWTVINFFPISCPPAPPTVDEYGIIKSYGSSTLQVCYDYRTTPMNKTFSSKQEAESFINGAPKCNDALPLYTKSCVENIAIEELK